MRNRLRVLRAERGWTQEELARRLGVSRQAIIAIENEKYDPSLSLAFRISRVFAEPIERLFDDDATTASTTTNGRPS
ncbi:MAG TPA: helix-turn-helix transcriptional regulator [Gemmatimonadaceae bacterium]|nr:helix-turn-helix transcriptional regulator [Gemmatimonadaceae bacterium]